MTQLDDLIDRYFGVWNETDETRREALIARTWTEGATYLDPLLCGEGHDGIDAMVRAVQAKYPGFRFSRDGSIDSHNDRARFGWSFGPGSGPAMARGLDVAIVAPDGRLEHVTGFFDEVLQAA
jgi:hypothetical protein